ncbi:putative lipid-binding transport protein (Tim44 family) [Pseudochelatococcus lubricantis]|uniref:Lipid-binding transport protein (Tim44 family) n=1 Tax=Pseudochelatococcus lubricantis TaxID=1538102 RepID=A0ABX0V2E9_9HYPH|nr:Tim44/TimA family putative adaptor protein [Pseudochelatococcus lubricantis]NIJ58395.1 putative lipid-binding transport protein (Tim44 family) [Pseudochelatococcus lubricantis]
MQDSFDIVTIVFLCLAVFVIWRLRSVLGQRTGNERPPVDPFTRRDARNGNGQQGAAKGQAEGRSAEGNGGNVVHLPGPANDVSAPGAAVDPDRWKGVAEPGSPIARGLDAVAAAEPAFDIKAFREGAKSAYEIIVTAFAQGDRKTLKGLLSREVFDGFDRAIGERERRGEVVNTTFVSVDSADIQAVEVQNQVAQITIRFASKLITATYDVEGKVIDGAADEVADVSDTWTFSRTLRSRDPNWLLIATESGH